MSRTIMDKQWLQYESANIGNQPYVSVPVPGQLSDEEYILYNNFLTLKYITNI